MTITEARAQLERALAMALPHCFVQVSPQALALVLAEREESLRGEEVDGAD